MALTQVSGDMIASGQTFTSPVLITPTINSAQIPTVSGTAPLYLCRAWVNFNGTGTVAIRASGNVTSITDVGTGNYTMNFTTAMADTSYAVTSLNRSPGVQSGFATQVETYSTGSVSFITLSSSLNAYDPVQVSVVIFR